MNWLRSNFSSRWVLLGIGTFLFSCAVVSLSMALTQGSSIEDLMLNLGSEMAGALITFLLVTGVLEWFRQQEMKKESKDVQQKKLILNAGSDVNEVARQALRDLMILEAIENSEGLLEGAIMIGANWENAWQMPRRLNRVFLEHANLKKAKLGQAQLVEAKLAEANMCECVLREANLRGSDLSFADLDRVKASWANFEECNLSSTTMRAADLQYCSLQGANLDRVNLEGAFMMGGKLRGAKNIELARFDDATVLPDASWDSVQSKWLPRWHSEVDMTRYTNPEHPNFWEPDWSFRIQHSNDTD